MGVRGEGTVTIRGVTPDEVFAGIRSRRRRQNEFEGHPLPEDRTLWIHWDRDDSD